MSECRCWCPCRCRSHGIQLNGCVPIYRQRRAPRQDESVVQGVHAGGEVCDASCCYIRPCCRGRWRRCSTATRRSRRPHARSRCRRSPVDSRTGSRRVRRYDTRRRSCTARVSCSSSSLYSTHPPAGRRELFIDIDTGAFISPLTASVLVSTDRISSGVKAP